MTKSVTVQTSIEGARRLRALMSGAEAVTSVELETKTPPPSGAVVVANPVEVPAQQTEGFAKNRTLRRLNGSTWEDTGQPVPVRVLTNGRQIAWPVGRNGLCVQDAAFWAVNIGSSAQPTVTVSAGVISGMSTTGVAAHLETQSDGKPKVTNGRHQFVRMDDGGTIADGTLIQLAWVSGNLTLVFANCGPTTGLTGLEAAPE